MLLKKLLNQKLNILLEWPYEGITLYKTETKSALSVRDIDAPSWSRRQTNEFQLTESMRGM